MADYPDNFTNYPESLGERKSSIEGNAALWTPRDVLIDMLRSIDSGKIEADTCVIVVNKVLGDGKTVTKWAVAGPDLISTLGMLEYAKLRMITVE